jgi:hypothetical protein
LFLSGIFVSAAQGAPLPALGDTSVVRPFATLVMHNISIGLTGLLQAWQIRHGDDARRSAGFSSQRLPHVA